MSKQKLWFEEYDYLEGVEKLQDKIETGAPINDIPDDTLIYQSDGPTPKISLRPAPGQKMINKRNASIVFGKDRPSRLESGYGGKGAPAADAIDIVVGRLSAARDGKGPLNGTIVNPHFGQDAARIYISQLTDIDNNFALVEKEGDRSTARAAIGIKADAVRIIGREGVNIVTGQGEWEGWQETNSRGGTIRRPAPPIKLIAGNRIGPKTLKGGIYLQNEKVNTLQPIPKGENLVLAMRELHVLLEKIMSAVFNLALVQTSFNGTLTGEPLLVATKVAGPVAAGQLLSAVVASVYQTRINSNLWETNYCSFTGHRYINSKNVFCT